MAKGLRQRPRLQFSLLTLMIAITLLAIPCAYVAYEAQIVRHRKAERAWLESRGVRFGDHDALRPSRLSWLRRLLGDESVSYIGTRESDLHERALKAFPEAGAFGW